MTKSKPAFIDVVKIISVFFIAPVMLSSCATAAYQVQEKFGIEKRDILVDRVASAAKSQTEAKEEFVDALTAFRAVVTVDGGELENAYDDMSKAYDRAESKADHTRSRVASVKRVARDLFKEWESELSQYDSASLRRSSEQQLRDTEQRYAVMTDKMDAATASMDPVLSVFKDRVLYLKHNLNARAIAALDAETADLETDVARLITEMERSIAAADAFINEMNS